RTLVPTSFYSILCFYGPIKNAVHLSRIGDTNCSTRAVHADFSIAIRKRKSAHIKHHLNDLAHCLSNSFERPSIITEQKNYCNKNYGVQSPGYFVRLCSQTKRCFTWFSVAHHHI